MLTELKHAPRDWVSIINMLSTVLHETASKRLRKNENGTTQTLLEVMTGIRPKRAFMKVMGVNAEPFTPRTLERETAQRVLKITLLSNRLHHLHKNVNKRMDRRK